MACTSRTDDFQWRNGVGSHILYVVGCPNANGFADLRRPEQMVIRNAHPAVVTLLLDVGNSRVAVGLEQRRVVAAVGHCPADRVEELPALLESAGRTLATPPTQAVICSVNDATLEKVCSVLADRLSLTPMIIGREIPLPMPMRIDNPERVGADRVCSAAAAFEQVRQACAIADLGTAITIDLASEQGEFLGGAILPGLKLAARALHRYTARLPEIEPHDPVANCGRNTVEAINNGIVLGVVGALREIVERYAGELGRWPPLVATGGDAELIARQCDFIDAVVPDLTLRGIALAYRRARARPDEP
jgi:type III pantothenate kinase